MFGSVVWVVTTAPLSSLQPGPQRPHWRLPPKIKLGRSEMLKDFLNVHLGSCSLIFLPSNSKLSIEVQSNLLFKNLNVKQ